MTYFRSDSFDDRVTVTNTWRRYRSALQGSIAAGVKYSRDDVCSRRYPTKGMAKLMNFTKSWTKKRLPKGEPDQIVDGLTLLLAVASKRLHDNPLEDVRSSKFFKIFKRIPQEETSFSGFEPTH
jgi:hypothetical protein